MDRLKKFSYFLLMLVALVPFVSINFDASEKASLGINIEDATINEVDGSATTVDSKGNYDVQINITGTDLDTLSYSDFKVMAGAYYNAPSDFEIIDSTSIVMHKEWKANEIKADFPINLVAGYGTPDETKIAVKAPTLVESEIISDNHVSSAFTDSSGQLHIAGELATAEVTKVDGSKTKINADGSVSVIVDIEGKRLDGLNKGNLRIKAGDYENSVFTYDINSDKTLVTISRDFSQNTLKNNAFPISVITYYNDPALEQIFPVTANASTENELEVNDYITYIEVPSATESIVIGVKRGEATIDSIDGSKTKINADGSVDVIVDVVGTDLDAIDKNALRIKAGAYYNKPSVTINGTSTLLTAKVHFSQKTLLNSEFPISLVFDYGKVTETAEIVTAMDTTANEATVSGITTFINVNSSSKQLSVGAKKIANPEVDASTIDGSKTKINADGSVDVVVDIAGTNLNDVNKNAVKIMAGPYKNVANVTVNSSGTLLTATHTFSKSTLLNSQFKISLVMFNGTADEQVIEVTALDSTADELTLGSVTTFIEVDSSSKVMSIGAREDKDASIDSSSIDGSKTKINADGSVSVVVTIEGDNLDKLDSSKVKIKAGKYNNSANVTVTSSNTLLTATHDFSQATLKDNSFAIGLVINAGLSDEEIIDVTANETTTDELTVGDYKTYIDINDSSSKMTIGANKVASSFIDLEVTPATKLPEYDKNTVISAEKLVYDAGIKVVGDGPFIYSGTVDTSVVGPQNAKITIIESNGDKQSTTVNVGYIVNETTTDLTVSSQFNVPVYYIGDSVSAEKLILDSNIGVSGDKPISYSGSVSTSTAGRKTTIITISEGSGDKETTTKEVNYEVIDKSIDLTVGIQTSVPTYKVDQIVSAEQLVSDAGVDYNGDMPIKITGTVPTLVAGEPFVANITFTEQSGDYEKQTVQIYYRVRASVPNKDLVVSSQTTTPTYELSEVVSAEKLVSDAGITYTGDTPINITGTVLTDTVGDLETTITFKETSGDLETKSQKVKYNVTSAASGDIVMVGQSGTNSATVKYTYNGPLDDAKLRLTQSGSLVAEVAINEETEGGFGYQVFTGLVPYISYNVKLLNGDSVLDEQDFTINGTFIASNYFDPYSNDGDNRGFNGSNEVQLTDRTYDNAKSRGLFSKYQIDTSQPFKFNGYYKCDGLAFPTASGKSLSFYQSKDGRRDHVGDVSETLGLLEGGSPYATNGISIALDSYGKDDGWGSGTQQVEIIDMSLGSGSGKNGNPYELYTANDGLDNKAIFWSENWSTFNVEWTPYADDSIVSGNLHVEVGVRYGDGKIEFDYQPSSMVFPQGYYWVKFGATTPYAGEFVSVSEMSFKIDDFSAAWVY